EWARPRGSDRRQRDERGKSNESSRRDRSGTAKRRRYRHTGVPDGRVQEGTEPRRALVVLLRHFGEDTRGIDGVAEIVDLVCGRDARLLCDDACAAIANPVSNPPVKIENRPQRIQTIRRPTAADRQRYGN